MASWNEAQHPRRPKGKQGGEWTNKGPDYTGAMARGQRDRIAEARYAEMDRADQEKDYKRVVSKVMPNGQDDWTGKGVKAAGVYGGIMARARNAGFYRATEVKDVFENTYNSVMHPTRGKMVTTSTHGHPDGYRLKTKTITRVKRAAEFNIKISKGSSTNILKGGP